MQLGQIESTVKDLYGLKMEKSRQKVNQRKVHRQYLQYMGMERREDKDEEENNKNVDVTINREGNHKVVFEKIQIFDSDGKVCHQLKGETILLLKRSTVYLRKYTMRILHWI